MYRIMKQWLNKKIKTKFNKLSHFLSYLIFSIIHLFHLFIMNFLFLYRYRIFFYVLFLPLLKKKSIFFVLSIRILYINTIKRNKKTEHEFNTKKKQYKENKKNNKSFANSYFISVFPLSLGTYTLYKNKWMNESINRHSVFYSQLCLHFIESGDNGKND